MTVGAAARRDGQRTWETCGPEGFRPDFSDGFMALAYHLRLILKVWLVEVLQLLVTEASALCSETPAPVPLAVSWRHNPTHRSDERRQAFIDLVGP